MPVSEIGLYILGELCAAKFAGDDQWYRAKIEKINGNKVKVFYVDYGNRDEIPSTSCTSLPPGFNSDKPYASEYALAFVKFGGDVSIELYFHSIGLYVPRLSVSLDYPN